MLKLLNSILEKALPDKSQQMVALITLFLASGILSLSMWAPKAGLKVSEEQIPAVQVQLILLLFLAALSLSYYLFYKQRSSLENLKNWKFHSKVNLQVGAYHDVVGAKNNRLMRIVLKDISVKSMPPQHEHLLEEDDNWPDPVDREVVTLSIEHNTVYPGSFVKKFIKHTPIIEEYYCLGVNKYDEENNSIFFFRTSHESDSDEFFRCFVEHINQHRKEAELNIYYLWLKRA